MSFSKKLKSLFRTKKRSVIVKEKSTCVLLSLIYFEEDRYVPNRPIVTCGRQNALTQVWTLNEHISTPVDNEKLLDVIQQSAKPSLPQQKEDTLPPVTIPEASNISDQDLFFRLMGQLEENNSLKQNNQRLVSQTTRLQLELETSKIQHEELFQSVHDELLAARCQLDTKNRNMAELETTILELRNNQTALEKDAAVQADRIEELNVEYNKVCAYSASMHRAVRGLHGARTVLQRDKANLIEQLDSKCKEIEEERATFDKNIEDLQIENEDNLIRVRNFHQALNNKRIFKMNKLEETVSDLNLIISEREQDHRTEMEAMEELRDGYSIAIEQRDKHLAQLESTVEELTKKNSELIDTVDEMELGSYALPDYYKILNVTRTDTDEKIMKSYKEKILLAHPDKINRIQTDDVEKALMKANRLSQALNRAKDLLIEPRLKYQYDIWLDMTEIKKTEKKIWDYKAFEERKRYRN